MKCRCWVGSVSNVSSRNAANSQGQTISVGFLAHMKIRHELTENARIKPTCEINFIGCNRRNGYRLILQSTFSFLRRDNDDFKSFLRAIEMALG